MYSFSAATGQTEAQPEGLMETTVDFPELEFFNRSITKRIIEPQDSFLKVISSAQVWSAVSVEGGCV